MPFIAMLALGAVLLGTVGLSVGSWWGGRGTTPLTPERGHGVATALLPGVVVSGASATSGYRYGVVLAPDDFGSGQLMIHYSDRADCALSERFRRAAAARGWQELRRVPGNPCEGWRAEADGLRVTLTHRSTGSVLSMIPAAPDRFVPTTIAGTLLGTAAGVVLFGWVARRRPPVRRLVGTLVTIGLLPAVALVWGHLVADGLIAPAWPIWRALAVPLVLLWLVLLLVGVLVFPQRPEQAEPSSGTPAEGPEPAAG